MSHTKEPWAYHTRGNYGAGEEADLSVEKLDSARGYLGLDDARRIVACVNTCAGISTESLEQGGVGSILSLGLSELKRGDVAEKQRDELESVVRNQSQNIAHLNDQLAGLRSDKAMLEIQRDELLAELDKAAAYHRSHECYSEAARLDKYAASVKAGV